MQKCSTCETVSPNNSLMRKTSLNCINELAKQDDRVLFIGSDLGPGVLEDMKQASPERFFMEGVSEQHIIGMSAGLAMEGFSPSSNTQLQVNKIRRIHIQKKRKRPVLF